MHQPSYWQWGFYERALLSHHLLSLSTTVLQWPPLGLRHVPVVPRSPTLDVYRVAKCSVRSTRCGRRAAASGYGGVACDTTAAVTVARRVTPPLRGRLRACQGGSSSQGYAERRRFVVKHVRVVPVESYLPVRIDV